MLVNNILTQLKMIRFDLAIQGGPEKTEHDTSHNMWMQ